MDRRSCTASSELEGGGAEMDSLWLPPGFRFHPTDEELILHYLHHKVQDESFNQGAIRGDVDLNKCEPWNLPGELKVVGGGEEEWYLYSKRDKKYPTGMRTNRATKAGYWKATGNDRLIVSSNPRLQLIGMRKTLVFYQGRAPHGHKTHWVMHEYRLEGPAFTHIPNESKEKWAVCRVFCKQGGQYSNKIPCKDFNDDESPMHKAHENMINNATSNHIQQSPCPPSSMEIEDIFTASPSSYDHKEYFDMFNIVGDSLAFSLEPNNL